MRNLLRRGEQATAYLHEFFHWLAARALGLRASIVVNPSKRFAYTDVDLETDWQEVIVALAPAMAGLLLMLWPIGLGSFSSWALLVLWQIGCLHDFAQVWNLAKEAISA